MAGSLIETLSGDFDPSEYKDSYRDALNAVIEAKVAGREVVQPESTQPTAGTVVDLMAALRASVEAAKAGRSEVEQPAAPGKAVKAVKAPKKAEAGKKAAKPVTKSAAKKAAAKKPAARKSA